MTNAQFEELKQLLVMAMEGSNGAETLPKGRISEQLIDQVNHSPQDAIVIPDNCLQVAVTCQSFSTNNAYMGWNEPATSKGTLMPGESRPYGDLRTRLKGNRLYIGFDPTGSGGKVLVSMIVDIGC